jgi:predicted acyl esterase
MPKPARMRRARACAVLAALASLLPALPSHAAPSWVAERPFVVHDRPGLYAVSPTTQQLTVRAKDGTPVFTETWLPAAKGGHRPPRRVPLVIVVTPYAFKGQPRPDRLNATARWTQFLVSHGYGLANVHLPGTGESGGCWGALDASDADAATRAIEALDAAPFASGASVLWGKSYDGGSALNVAEHGTPKGVRALLVVSPVTSMADFRTWDGVPQVESTAVFDSIDADTSLAGRSFDTNYFFPGDYVEYGNKDPRAAVARTPCRVDEALGTVADGRVTPWLAARELALRTDRIRVPVLMTYGLQETQTRQIVGAFDGIRTRKVGLFSQSGHDYPDQNSVTPRFSRQDWEAVALAWLDHYLLGTHPDVNSWPTAQVQDTTGAWRAEPRGFPRTGGPAGWLALGAGGLLGATHPTGSDSYVEATTVGTSDESYQLFTTPPLKGTLQLSGQLEADLWLQTNLPRGAVEGQLEVLAPDGTGTVVATGMRSLQFLAPLQQERFIQAAPVTPPVDTPLHVTMRFPVGDVVVPAGSRLRLLLGGSVDAGNPIAVEPSTITLLHDCAHPSAVRFVLPDARPDLIDVDDRRDPASYPAGLRDGGGLATAPVSRRR